MSLFLLSVVDENNLSKFGRICLEIVVPGPLSDVLELGLPTAVVNCWNQDICIVCISSASSVDDGCSNQRAVYLPCEIINQDIK